MSTRNTTRIDSGPEEPVEPRSSTLLEPGNEDVVSQRKKPQAHHRRLTGVLVTFRWTAQGELFPLYEGRNVIGSDSSCDIQIKADPTMSGEHALILCRAGRDELHDMLSTNGTFLNEQYVGREGADLNDGVLVKTGATIFEFRKFTSGGERPKGEIPEYVEHERPGRRSGETEI